jgi:hypothetical protein
MLENLGGDVFLSGVAVGAIAFFIIIMVFCEFRRFMASLWARFESWLDERIDKYIYKRGRLRKGKACIKDIDTGLELDTIRAKWKGKKNEP